MIKIYIDQGHNPSGFNTGAEGNGYYEQDITYEIGRRLYNLLLSNPEFEPRLSRPTPETVLGTNNSTSLVERVNQANSWGADIFIYQGAHRASLSTLPALLWSSSARRAPPI